jgi:hypothetical protein
MKKAAALAILAMVAIATAQPAVAGVGGCYGKIGVGGCGGWALTESGRQATSNTPSVLDSLNAALPADVVAFLKAMFEAPETPTVVEPAPTTQGVGGCFGKIGVGGCAL